MEEMIILVYDFDNDDDEEDSLIKSKDIICPSCKEFVKLNLMIIKYLSIIVKMGIILEIYY